MQVETNGVKLHVLQVSSRAPRTRGLSALHRVKSGYEGKL
jgi:hypothetical protein